MERWESAVVDHFRQSNALEYGQEMTMSLREALMDQKQERQDVLEVGSVVAPLGTYTYPPFYNLGVAGHSSMDWHCR